MAEHDVLVLPSTYEPYGLVVLEGMFVGLPAAVSRRCGCVADLITNETGWSFDPHSTHELTRAFSDIDRLSDEDLKGRVEAARRHAATYSTGRSVELTTSAIEPLLR
jgi:glycosyltransferase involved in cell wall biosynthesis